MPKLLGSIEDAKCQEFTLVNTLDILNEMIQRNASVLQPFSKKMHDLMMKLLDHPRSLVRKKVISGYTLFILGGSADLFNDFLKVTLSRTCNVKELQDEYAKSFLFAWMTIVRLDPTRFTDFIPNVLPIILNIIKVQEDRLDSEDGDDEVLEYAFLALDAILSKCFHESEGSISKISTAALKFINHDPNYQDLVGI